MEDWLMSVEAIVTIEITRPSGGTFQYRQREDEPNVIESRATYRGARWQFVARYADAEQAHSFDHAVEIAVRHSIKLEFVDKDSIQFKFSEGLV